MFSCLHCIPTVILLLHFPAFLLAGEREKPEKVKSEKTPAAAKGKIAGQLQKTFKLWDKNKDGSADKEELEKFYVKLKVKPKKRGGAPAADAGDPMAPVNALRSKADADGDEKISLAEFNEWATNFTEYASKVSALQVERAGSEREMANLQGLLDRSGKVTAADGIFEQEARRGLITYKQSLERIDGSLKDLAAEGHSEYEGLFMPQGR